MASNPEALGIAFQHHRAGQLVEAEEVCRQILVESPSYAEALNLLGVISFQTGRQELAVEYIRRAIQSNGSAAAFHNNLGNVRKAQGKLGEAAKAYQRAAELKPESGAAHYNLGSVLLADGKTEDAIVCLGKALELRPNHHETLSNLGSCYQVRGNLDEAADWYRRALAVKPESVETLYNLGCVLLLRGKLGEAIGSLQRAVSLRPDFAEAWFHLGNALGDQGEADEAIGCYRRALEIRPGYVEAYSNILLAIQYHVGVKLPELLEMHREFDRRFAAPLQTERRPHENDRDGERRLRLGFISPNFRQHPVGHFVIRALENLDREQCEIFGYCDWPVRDEYTRRFEGVASVWREVSRASDVELTEQIRADQIDILFDLAGHTAKNRLLVFARKPAPIQVTWADYVGTTGLEAMDYILADHREIPVEAERYYAERVVRMPDGYICYDPPAYV